MSGDVQPRKRKDKKRRKDEGEQIPIQTHAPLPTNNSANDDLNIHIHKEGGTGGGICAKLVFFVLLSAIAVLIGMIITEYRGQTDVDTVDTESRFSQIFEGWTDASPDHHDEHDVEDLEDHDLDHDDEDDVENISDAEDEEEEEHEPSEEEDEEEEVNDDNEESEEDHDDTEEDQDEDEEQEEQAVEDSEENQLDEDDDEVQDSDEEEPGTYEESDEKGEDEEADEDHDDDEQELQNIDSEEKENDDDEQADEEDEVSSEKKSKEQDDDVDEDEADENDDKVVIPSKKIKVRDVVDDETPPDEKQQESSGSAVAKDDVDDSDSDKESDDATGYEYSNITNKEDLKIKGDIDKAHKTIQNNSAYAIKLFDKILQNYPSSPRSIYGKALALDYLADQKRSNPILEQALKFYTQLFNTENVPQALFEMAAERCINRMRFVGQYKNVINIHKQLIGRFPDNPKHSNDLAVTYLTINRVEAARSVLKEILRKWPKNGFALVHFGFILKTADNKLQEAVEYLRKGLETKDEGVVDGRFYFHLGDALTRLGLNKEAMEVYEEGVKNKVFLSKYQRSLYNVPRLTGRPWWKLEELPYKDLYRLLKQNWHKVKEEGLTVLNEKGYFQDESENLRDSGEWKQFELFARGQKNIQNCKKCPVTCSIIEKIPEASGCKRGQTKFSVMHPGTHVWPHCGPTNCRLRTHLGLKVPARTFIRVAEEVRSWKEGEIFVFDDSFEHEVWHNGTDFRLVLIIDVWHPELTPVEKRNLSPI